ncbi:MAG: leucine-rich repeat protein [Candidatus Nanopelagicales bacterium]
MTTNQAARRETRRSLAVGIATVGALLAPFAVVLPAAPASATEVQVNYLEYETYAKAVGCESPCVGTLTIADTYNGRDVTIIEDAAFYGKTGLTGAVVIPDTVTTIGNGAFNGATGLTGISMSADSSLTTIEELAFENASGLSGTLALPNSVTTIGAQAFRGASSLTGLTLGNSVQTIGAGAFRGATSLRGRLTIPASVTSVGDQSLLYVTGLTDIRFLGARPPTFGTNAFIGSGTAPIYHKQADTTWATTTEINSHPVVAVPVPTFTTNPSDTNLLAGQTLNLLGAATAHSGGGTLHYQWFKDDAAISSPRTTTTFSKRVTTTDDAGTYTVKATTWAGTTESTAATVSVSGSTSIPSPTPTKTHQTIAVKLPNKMKRNKRYPLPRTSLQGQALTWKSSNKRACVVKKSSVRCKSSSSKKVTLTATAAATATLHPYTIKLKRKLR